MRIACFVLEYPCWSETFVASQIDGLLNRGHDVEVFAARQGAPLPDTDDRGPRPRTHIWPLVPPGRARRALEGLGCFTAALRANPRTAMAAVNVARHGRLAASLELLHRAIALMPRRHFDAVHCHFGPNGVLAQALRETGVLCGPLVTTFHAYDLTRYVRERGRGYYRRLFRGGDLFLAVSERGRRRLIELGCPASKVRVHHMGVDCSRFAPRERTPDSARASPSRSASLQLLSIGRLVEKKGFAYGIRALAELQQRGYACRYTIVGEGPLRSVLEGLVRDLDLGETVSFAGRRSSEEVRTWLAASDVLLAPSHTASDGDEEGIPVVLMEAMAMAVPVVSTRHSGIPELIEDGVSGLLAPEREANGLADRVANLIDDPARRRALGAAGRAAVEQRFNVEILNDRLVGTLAEVAAGYRGS